MPLLHEELCRQAPNGLCSFDTDLRYVYINDWLATINGLTVQQHLGHRIGDILPKVAEGVESQLRDVLETGEPLIQGTAHVETPAHPGSRRHYEHSYYPDKSDEGTVEGLSCVVEDVTERRETEEALKQLLNASAELEDRVAQPTEALGESWEQLRALHYDPSQLMTALKMDLFQLTKTVAADDKESLDKVGSMLTLVDSAIDSGRRLSTRLVTSAKPRRRMDSQRMGAAIRESRERAGFTLRDVARLLQDRYGIQTTFGSLGRIERHEQRPEYFVLLALAHLYSDVVGRWMALPESEWPPGLIEKLLNREAIHDFICTHVAMNHHLDAIYAQKKES